MFCPGLTVLPLLFAGVAEMALAPMFFLMSRVRSRNACREKQVHLMSDLDFIGYHDTNKHYIWAPVQHFGCPWHSFRRMGYHVHQQIPAQGKFDGTKDIGTFDKSCCSCGLELRYMQSTTRYLETYWIISTHDVLRPYNQICLVLHILRSFESSRKSYYIRSCYYVTLWW